MKHHSWRDVFLAMSLSALAGYIDALGFLSLGGLFVSFMSGNTTRLAAGVAEGVLNGAWLHAALAVLIIVLFVLGVVAGRLAQARRPSRITPSA